MRFGLIVNPIAGLGGAVGLKGTDGAETVRRALELGAVARAGERALLAMQVAQTLRRGTGVEVVTAPGVMGEDAARRAHFDLMVLELERRDGPEDTVAAARGLVAAGVELLVFVGGDGTARDVLLAVGEAVPVIGVPAGVKMHSAVHATSPVAAGALIGRFLSDLRRPTRLAEVMDIDEEAYRAGALSARLYGFLRVPVVGNLVQGLKARGAGGEEAALGGIAAEVAARLVGRRAVLGPGTTVRAVAERLGVAKTLLGVDVVDSRADGSSELVAADVGERDLLALTAERLATIVVTPIGGQGFVFGRGNQQISAAVIRQVGWANVVIVATPGKLAGLGGRPLLVDTGDVGLDLELRGHAQTGHARIVVGRRAEVVYGVRPA